jgi:hypothetical protein
MGVGGGAYVLDEVLDEVTDLHEQFSMIDDADSAPMSMLIDVLKGSGMVVKGLQVQEKLRPLVTLLQQPLRRVSGVCLWPKTGGTSMISKPIIL